jgi:hypothetical protein
MSTVITAVAHGSPVPHVPSPPPVLLPNGDFTIEANEETTQPIGNGINEKTTWMFDFREHPAFNAFLAGRGLEEARLVVVIVPKEAHVTTDSVKIIDGDLPTISLPRGEYQLGLPTAIQFDLLRECEGYDEEGILTAFKEGEHGLIKMLYEEDAVVCHAAMALAR